VRGSNEDDNEKTVHATGGVGGFLVEDLVVYNPLS
jgi:hypothetical protein